MSATVRNQTTRSAGRPLGSELSPAKSALILLDFQTAILSSLPDDLRERTVNNAVDLLHAAREAGFFVVHVAVRYRANYPEVSSSNKRVSALRDLGMLREGDVGSEFHEQLAPRNDEVVVVKRRVSALSATDLPVVLRSAGIHSLLLAGVITSGAVTSTVRQAADEDYSIIVAEDACADPNEAAHEALMQHIFPVQATVIGTADLAPLLRRYSP